MTIKQLLTTLCLLPAIALAEAGEKLDTVKANLSKRYPATQFEVATTPIEGVYSVKAGKNAMFVDTSGRYFLFGYLFDMETQTELGEGVPMQGNEAEEESHQTISFKTLPLSSLAIKEVRGNGSRQLVVFVDPECGYCKRLSAELIQLSDVTIYSIMYPILGQRSVELSKQIWCSNQPAEALNTHLSGGVGPQDIKANCEAPVSDWLSLGKKLGVLGTPFMISGSDQTMPGYTTYGELNQWLSH